MTEESPKLLSFATYRTMLRYMLRGALDHRINGLAAEVAFFALFGLPSALLALVSAIGFVGGYVGQEAISPVRVELLVYANRFLSQRTVHEVVAPMFDDLFREGRADLLSVGVIVAIWSASRASESLVSALYIAYGIDERMAIWRRRGKAILHTIAALVWGAVVLPLLVLGPNFGRAMAARFGVGDSFDLLWAAIYWPLLASLLLITLAGVYHLAIPWKMPFWRNMPGALLAMLLWLLGGIGVRAYGSWVSSSVSLFGSLASPMVMLLWLYFTAIGVLVGAELNAAVEHIWPTATRKEKRALVREAALSYGEVLPGSAEATFPGGMNQTTTAPSANRQDPSRLA